MPVAIKSSNISAINTSSWSTPSAPATRSLLARRAYSLRVVEGGPFPELDFSRDPKERFANEATARQQMLTTCATEECQATTASLAPSRGHKQTKRKKRAKSVVAGSKG